MSKLMKDIEPAKAPFWRRRVVLLLILFVTLPAAFGLWVFADWWFCLPEDSVATYVGSQSCIQCHQPQAKSWHGSHHDLAMDRATEKTVLGNFDNAELAHFGIESRMFRKDGKFLVHTEGPDGELSDFEVKYVFGVEPLQQYMVEFDRADDMPEHEVARLQVLRISWDTEKKRWFYLSPPDVDEKLSPDDDLHWTGVAQRWNTMCAECHSTNLHKNFDVKTRTYHTTFTEIDVSCEACHGPGSVHVELAKNKKMFWDRKRGYGLPHLKSENTEIEIQTCATCHSRRRIVHPNFRPGEDFYDYFANELLFEQTYHADGQILDEVYVHGSFIQSKMYHKDIRCTDCHDPHTARLKHEGNKVCTSCHEHHPAHKYDNENHHHHKPGTKGASCVECHMPETTYMAVDPRRDHSLRIPRPDLSVKLGTPNACTRCHITDAKIDEEKRKSLPLYQDWLLSARTGDKAIGDELSRLDQWSDENIEKWFGENRRKDVHFAESLYLARRGDPKAEDALLGAQRDRNSPAIAKATAIFHLGGLERILSDKQASLWLQDKSPLVRAAALSWVEAQIPQLEQPAARAGSQQELEDVYRPTVEAMVARLRDPTRLVRTEAARVLATTPNSIVQRLTSDADRASWKKALDEFERGLMAANDRAAAHMNLGILKENLGNDAEAIKAYRTAMQVEPRVTGPRTNLAAVIDRQAEEAANKGRQAGLRQDRASMEKWMKEAADFRTESAKLRREELPLLARDAMLAPDNDIIQYRYGMSAYLNGQTQDAEKALLRATRIAPQNPQYLLALALLYQKMERWREALYYAEQLNRRAPGAYPQLLDDIRNRRPPNM